MVGEAAQDDHDCDDDGDAHAFPASSWAAWTVMGNLRQVPTTSVALMASTVKVDMKVSLSGQSEHRHSPVRGLMGRPQEKQRFSVGSR